MRVVFLSETFSPKMGYIQNTLPKYLARLGAEVHVVTADLPPYYQLPDYSETYSNFHGDALQAGTVERTDGFTVHVIGHRRTLGYVRMSGLFAKLRELRPAILQSIPAIGWIALDAALMKPVLGYKLFTGCHTTASVFPLAGQSLPVWNRRRLECLLTRTMPGRLVSAMTEFCYSATADCADVATRFFGVPQSKNVVCSLGVDTERFHPVQSAGDLSARNGLRSRFGWRPDEIVCVYSGRFSEEKNPLVLAQAIDRLSRSGRPYRGLFIGAGVQAERLRACAQCATIPFVPVSQLAGYFRAAEIGVWPAQESMSMLDAAACGLPIVVNDTLVATERIEGNGLTYRLGDTADLARVLSELADPVLRRRLGECGARRMRRDFSWEAIAGRRMRDYLWSLNGRNGRCEPSVS